MPQNSDQYDFFVSYARHDNASGWITRFVEQIQEEHRKYSGGREFRVFFDKTEIRSLDDWRHRIYESVAASRLMVAFISPAYLASEWCRREWRTWIDVEIAKHVLSDGAAPIYIVEVPWLSNAMSDQQVGKEIAKLSQRPVDTVLARDAMAIAGQVSQRQLTMVRQFFYGGLEALRLQDLLNVLTELTKNLSARSEHVEAAARSRSTIPPYNRRFVGRLEELAMLRERLHQGRTGVISGHKGSLPQDRSTIASVHGLGGIGKTELAFTYAHAFAGLYPGGRLLVPCEGRFDLRQAMLALDEVFREQISDEQRKTLDLHFGAIRDCLRQRLRELGPILLVLDNVNDRSLLSPEQTDHVRTLGPDLHLLATTRLGAPEGAAFEDIHWLTLGELSLEDSLRLLEKYRLFATPEEQTAAERIARRLGGFALCVEVVGAYLSQHLGKTYAGYLELMGLTDLERVDQTAERGDVTTRRHNNEKRLGAILVPTLANLPAEAVTALEFAALLPPDHIVIPWLHSLVTDKHSGLANDAGAWQRLIAGLESLALLTRGQDVGENLRDESQLARILRCHRLLQDYMREHMTAEEKGRHQHAVDGLMRECVAALEKTTQWRDARWELDPLDALAGLWGETSHADAAWLLGQVGRYWSILADWSHAEPLLRRALAVDEYNFGPDHPKVALRLNNLAQMLQATNRLAEAEPLMRQVLAMNEQSFGPDDPYVAVALNNLARLLRSTSRYEEAEPLLRRALAINEKCFGPEHPNVAVNLTNLAVLLQVTSRYEAAESLYRRALAINEKCFGPENSNVATSLNNLVFLLLDRNRLVEAEPLIRRTLVIIGKSLGPEHPQFATALNNLAQVLYGTNRLTEAEPLYRRTLAIDEHTYGPNHPDVARDLSNLAFLLRDTSRLAESEPLMRRALAIDELSFGLDHPKIAIRLENLASVLVATNRLEEVEPLLRRALAIADKNFGPDHPKVAEKRDNWLAAVNLILPPGLKVRRPPKDTDNESSSIFTVASAGDVDVIKALLKGQPGLVGDKDRKNATPLHYAAANGQIEVVELLLASGATVDAKDNDGFTPLLAASKHGYPEVVAVLLSHGAGVDVKDCDGFTALHQAAGLGYKEIAGMLLGRRANVEAKNNVGFTVLHLAAGWGHKEIAEMLLAHQADANARDNTSFTPLHAASINGHIDIVVLLLANGADLSVKTNNGDTPLDLAMSKDKNDIADLLRRQEVKNTDDNNVNITLAENPPSVIPAPSDNLGTDRFGHSSVGAIAPVLLTCKHCSQKFDPKNPTQCSYHPQEPELIDSTGPSGDYTVVYSFPCCRQVVVADNPPKSPGCRKGKHEANNEPQLLVCKNCGQKFDPSQSCQCSYHPQKANWIGGTGPRDEWDKYVFPCCGLGFDGYEHRLDPRDWPPQSPGCKTGNHEA